MYVVFFCLSCSKAYAIDPISVEGNEIFFGSSNAPIAGNSFSWSNEGNGAEDFYNADVVSWLRDDWNSRIVRVAIGVEEDGGYLTYPEENVNRAKTIIDAAIDNDMYVIIDWHTFNAEEYEDAAITFF